MPSNDDLNGRRRQLSTPQHRREKWFSWCLMAYLVASSCLTMANAIPLLGGRFETTTDVQYLLNLALDAAEMRESENLETKANIYKNGISRPDTSGPTVTLQSLSLDAKNTMEESPMYNIFIHAFKVLGQETEGETIGNFDGKPIEQYGDTLVNDLFQLDVADIETEAAIVMNVWMACVHELFQVMQECKASDEIKGLAALDRAAALWVGEGQEDGNNDVGHLLYNLAENAGERFDQDNGEALVNTQIIEIMLSLQTTLLANRCDDDQGYLSVRRNVKALLSLMTTPLIQNLIHYSMNLQVPGASSFVELYVLATIPRVAACDPDAYDDELNLDVVRAMQSNTVQDSLDAIQRAYKCFDITCAQVGSYLGGAVPECQDYTTAVTAAGYTTSRAGAKEKVALDRDVKEIGIFMEQGAFGAAEDWYTYGWNSIDYNLKKLARDQLVPAVDPNTYLELYAEYFNEPVFPDILITNIMQLNPPYNAASLNQLTELVLGILKYVVVFISSVSSLQYAAYKCNSDSTAALDYWDTGALLYVGSIEGEEPNGSRFGGEFLFSTAKELCSDFGKCVDGETNKAAVNEVVMEGLKDGINAIRENNCVEVQSILDGQLVPNLIVPLIQGTIKYASINSRLAAGSDESSLAIGDSFARSIIPVVDKASPGAGAAILQQMELTLLEKPVAGGFDAVATALRKALPSMSTSCTDIGTYIDEPTLGYICEGAPPMPTPTQAPMRPPVGDAQTARIAFGRYEFEDLTVAEGDGSFALDVRDMFQATNLAEAREIYTNGQNAVTTALSGQTGTVSLSSMSIDAGRYMAEDIMFNIYKYALFEDAELDSLSGADFDYADDIVLEAMDDGKDNKLAAEASVVMNVWMVMVHKLYEAVRSCSMSENPVPLIDSTVALWIGKGQVEGKFDDGWMMYSIAQSAAENYGLQESEAAINTELMTLFNEAQAIAKTCMGATDASLDLNYKVHELIQVLTKPLILTLLFHLVSDSKNMVELYAVAVIPQAYTCGGTLGADLTEALFDGYTQAALNDDLIQNLATFLRCQRISSRDLSHSPNVDVKLRNLLGSLTTQLDYWVDSGDYIPMAGYSPFSDVSEIARLDLDIKEIDIMMRTKAFDAAKSVYEKGHHSRSTTEPSRHVSLKSLATSSERDGVIAFPIYSTYFSSSTYADDIMKDALFRSGSFASASRGQLAELASRTLQTMVSFMSVMAKMETSVEFCNLGKPEEAQYNWDSAVALYIGSSEGLLAGGLSTASGGFMYSLGNEVCDQFLTCEASGEAKVNEELLVQFVEGRDAVKNTNCDHLERIKTWEILPRMSVPLIQGTLMSAFQSSSSSAISDARAAAHIMAKAIIPLVDEVNTTSADTIYDDFGNFNSVGFQALGSTAEALSYALRGMGIACQDIGIANFLPGNSLCLAGGPGNVPDQAPVADTSTDLGNGLYVTTTYVEDKANIAKDVADMEEALESNSLEMAKLIYRDGKNSDVYDEDGKFVSLRSLRGFSTEEYVEMLDEPLFNIYLYALQDSNGRFLSKDSRLYADSLVQNAFQQMNSETRMLPVEAAVALNLWMHVVHLLYNALHDCKNKQIRNEDGIHSMDIAVAYWIGDGQIAGSGENGHLLYALAERMGVLFNMDEGGQSRTNTNILKLFNEAKHEISLPGACSDAPASYLKLSVIANKIISVMAVPLIQSLIHNLRVNDRSRVSLYAHAVVPLAAGCSPSAFEYLEEKLLKMNYNVVEIEDIIASIRNIYPCLGLTCEDIGVHESEMTDEGLACEDPDVFASLAGYKPSSDIREYSRLDLDMRELDILLQMKAYEAAETLYTHGKHVKGTDGGSMSLYYLASTLERNVVPEYDAFIRYYSNNYYDANLYADQVIRSALKNTNSESDAHRRAIVMKAAQVMVLYLGALQALYEAVSDCETTASFRQSGFSDSWDRGAAILIGSLEGSQTNGTQEGYMYYHLAQEHCQEFGTCSNDNTGASVNDELVSLLYTGRGAVLGNSCNALRKAADEISSLLLVPAIQGALSSSIKLSSLSTENLDVVRAEGYVYSRALLPLVDSVDRGAAQNIDSYLGFPGASSTRQTASVIFSSFARVYPDLNVDCELIGESSGDNACTGVVYNNGLGQMGVLVMSVVGGLCCLCCCGWAWARRNTTARLAENNPKFIASETGELNHSMDLLEKAFSSNSRPRTPQRTGETVALAADMVHDASPGDDDDFEEATALKSRMESSDIDII